MFYQLLYASFLYLAAGKVIEAIGAGTDEGVARRGPRKGRQTYGNRHEEPHGDWAVARVLHLKDDADEKEMFLQEKEANKKKRFDDKRDQGVKMSHNKNFVKQKRKRFNIHEQAKTICSDDSDLESEDDSSSDERLYSGSDGKSLSESDESSDIENTRNESLSESEQESDLESDHDYGLEIKGNASSTSEKEADVESNYEPDVELNDESALKSLGELKQESNTKINNESAVKFQQEYDLKRDEQTPSNFEQESAIEKIEEESDQELDKKQFLMELNKKSEMKNFEESLLEHQQGFDSNNIRGNIEKTLTETELAPVGESLKQKQNFNFVVAKESFAKSERQLGVNHYEKCSLNYKRVSDDEPSKDSSFESASESVLKSIDQNPLNLDENVAFKLRGQISLEIEVNAQSELGDSDDDLFYQPSKLNDPDLDSVVESSFDSEKYTDADAEKEHLLDLDDSYSCNSEGQSDSGTDSEYHSESDSTLNPESKESGLEYDDDSSLMSTQESNVEPTLELGVKGVAKRIKTELLSESNDISCTRSIEKLAESEVEPLLSSDDSSFDLVRELDQSKLDYGVEILE